MDLIENQLSDPLNHWYYSHKFSLIYSKIDRFLKDANVLIDIGAGSALFSKKILEKNVHLKCIAVDTGYTETFTQDSSDRISYQREIFGEVGDIYLLTDVLEHVEDDCLFLGNYVSKSPELSIFVVTVPAFMSLWSGHDVFLKHFRRYRKKELVNVIESSGLTVLDSHYTYSILFPAAWFVRKLPRSRAYSSQLVSTNLIINFALKCFLKLDKVFSRVLPFGVSILVIAQKPRATSVS